MNLNSVTVTGLFNTFDHKVSFNKNGIAIIIGENGIGKTTILHIIDSVFNQRLDYLFSIEFGEVLFSFTDFFWRITKKDEHTIQISNSKEKEPFCISQIRDREQDYFIRRFLVQLSDNEWLDRRRGIRLTRDDIIQQWGFDPLLNQTTSAPEWFLSTVKENHVRHIKTQRLFQTVYDRDKDIKEAPQMVNVYSKELVDRIRQENAIFTSTSIQLDSTFPMRLLKELKRKHKNDISTVIDSINSLSQYRRLLSSVGIIERQDDEVLNRSIETLDNQSALSILNLYIEDNQKKLDTFNNTARKLNLLLNIINKRFKHKTLSIDKEQGFVIHSNLDGHIIEVEKLSSGEQNELIIFYNLLFKSSTNDIVLIDEPEISLHISWQQSLIRDLFDVSKESSITMLLSTHSPDIIGDNWSLVQTLESKE